MKFEFILKSVRNYLNITSTIPKKRKYLKTVSDSYSRKDSKRGPEGKMKGRC